MEERIDPFYYIPSLIKLEKKVWSKNAVPLRNFINRMSSGATPSKNEEEKFYTTKESNGIPFVRVQNLSDTSELLQDDLRYINAFTHNFYLKRSQIEEGDLLTKITGVGRMAVSAVVPSGFKGNINQHIVVSKTENADVSEVLATFLNSELGEKLASRRATGGTRPALDYPALRSIPIVYKPEIVPVLKEGVKQKQQKEQQAKELLNSIDDYLLKELGVQIPIPLPNNISNRMFRASRQKVASSRFDPHFHDSYYYHLENILLSKPHQKLKRLVSFSTETWDGEKYFTNTFPYIEIGEIDLLTGEINRLSEVSVAEAPSRAKMIVRNEDLLISMTRPNRGAICFYENPESLAIASTGFGVARGFDEALIDKNYLRFILRSPLGKLQMTKRSSGGNYPAITQAELEQIIIPIPDLPIQKRIATTITSFITKAKHLREEAQQQFTQTKKEIERMILE